MCKDFSLHPITVTVFSLSRSCLTGPFSPSEVLSLPILGLKCSVKREERNERDKVHGKTNKKGVNEEILGRG